MGTANPVHYNVIYNSTKLPLESFYELIKNLCYNYFNWMGPVKIPSVLQLAHKMANHEGVTLQNDAEHYRRVNPLNENIKEKLFYL